MPRATCRCGQILSIPTSGPDRVVCPKCSSRIRVRRDSPKVGPGDGFIRFNCPCGRRLKVRDTGSNEVGQAGKCPDCGRVVPVPSSSSSSGTLRARADDPETPTEDMGPEELAMIDRWARSHLGNPAATALGPAQVFVPPAPPPPEPTMPAEAGLRVCPRCGRPLHLSAVTCRECGAAAPKR